MSVHQIEALPDEARVWIFGSPEPLDPERRDELEDLMPPFLERWTAHRRDLRAAWDLREDRFLVVAVDESAAPASGCSIDTLMRHLSDLEERLDTSLLDAGWVWYRGAGGTIEAVRRHRLGELAEEGRVTGATPVFDPTLATLGELRRGRLERPARDSWHGRLLPEPATDPASSGSA